MTNSGLELVAAILANAHDQCLSFDEVQNSGRSKKFEFAQVVSNHLSLGARSFDLSLWPGVTDGLSAIAGCVIGIVDD